MSILTKKQQDLLSINGKFYLLKPYIKALYTKSAWEHLGGVGSLKELQRLYDDMGKEKADILLEEYFILDKR